MRISSRSAVILFLIIIASLASVIRWPGSDSVFAPDGMPFGLGGEREHEVFCPWASLPWSSRAALFGEEEEPVAEPLCRFEIDVPGEPLRVLDIGGGEVAMLALEPATPLQFPRIVDSNSPAFWADGKLVLFNSLAWPAYVSGAGLEDLSVTSDVDLVDRVRDGGFWLESVWRDETDGLVYGWYHLEPGDLECLTTPLIGAAVSYDNGRTWQDRGSVLESGQPIDCSFENGYFAGGHGDFSVILDSEGEYFYFLFTDYGGEIEEQGISLARSSFADKGQPGTAYKYFDGAWDEPGLGGRSNAVIASSTGWQTPDVEEFWGPSVHWNTQLKRYVVLLNRTQGYGWDQEGIYIAFSRDLIDWTAPEKLLNSTAWYPQVIGLSPGETDSLAGEQARLYVGGISTYILKFHN